MIKKQPQEEDDIILDHTDESGNESSQKDKIKDLREKLELALKERGDYLTGWQRAQADYVNLKREMEQKLSGNAKYAHESVIMELLPALDSLDLAMGNKEAWEKVSPDWRKGIEYVAQQLDSALASHGLEYICPKPGDAVKFENHAVVETISSSDRTKDDTVASVLQRGYLLHGKVIRPARVSIYSFKQ